jgi:hypothetical protein
MSTSEIVTWQLGVDRKLRGLSINGLLLAPRWMQDRQCSPEHLAARVRLGNDSWAYWVRRGYDDASESDARTV